MSSPTRHYFLDHSQVRRLLRAAEPEWKTASYIGHLVRLHFIKQGHHGMRPGELDSYLDGRTLLPWLRTLVADKILEVNTVTRPRTYRVGSGGERNGVRKERA